MIMLASSLSKNRDRAGHGIYKSSKRPGKRPIKVQIMGLFSRREKVERNILKYDHIFYDFLRPQGLVGTSKI